MSDIEIEIIEPRHDDDLYKARIADATTMYERHRNYQSKKQMIDVLSGLCRIAYQKGYHYGKKDAGGQV